MRALAFVAFVACAAVESDRWRLAGAPKARRPEGPKPARGERVAARSLGRVSGREWGRPIPGAGPLRKDSFPGGREQKLCRQRTSAELCENFTSAGFLEIPVCRGRKR